ncbi:MAG: hypothetical protein ABI629_22775, partial [bacterium]
GAAVALSPLRSGAFNGGISALDASYILQSIAGRRTLDADASAACDATGNGTLSTLDATRILEFAVGMRAALPVAQSCGSDWLFIPEPAAAAGQQTTQPSTVGTCVRGAIAFAALPASASDQDFRAALFGDCTGNWQPPGGAAFSRGGAPLTLGPALAARGQLRVPLRLRGGQALELVLRADPARLRFVTARAGDGAVVRARSSADGRVRIAAASATSLGAARLVVLFDRLDATATLGDVTVEYASLDEAPLATRKSR